MIPPVLLDKLARLRRRERSLQWIWGIARLLALFVGVLLLACLADWLVDRRMETPQVVRYALTLTLAVAALVGLWFFVLRPLRRLPDDQLALWVEDAHPRLQERLVTAVELNRPAARLQGMSAELVEVVTNEAVARTKDLDFAAVADGRRLGWALLVLLPVLLLFGGAWLLWSDVMTALVARQFLADLEVPRTIAMENITREVWPSGDKAKLEIQVRSKNPLPDDLEGLAVVRIDEGGLRDEYPLRLTRRDDDHTAVFAAEMPPGSKDFSFSAWLGDGRLRDPGSVRFEPRPVVVRQDAFVQLPAFCGLCSDGTRFEIEQEVDRGKGVIAGIPGSTVRLVVHTQKPIVRAALHVFGPKHAPKSAEEIVPEVFRRAIPLMIAQDGASAEAVFDLRPADEESTYEVEVIDRYGFANEPRRKRGLRMIPEDPPLVRLHPEQFPPAEGIPSGGTLEDFTVSGLPGVLGKPIRVAYEAQGPYGLGQAWLLYRVLKPRQSGNEEAPEPAWTRLPLPEVKGTKETGAFDPRRGVFERTPFDKSVPFHAVPSADPDRILGRKLGGGRYDLNTAKLLDAAGNPLTVAKGDQIEYCIEVFADPDPSKEPGKSRPRSRSETRITNMVDVEDFRTWLFATLREEEQIRQIDAQQRNLDLGGKR